MDGFYSQDTFIYSCPLLKYCTQLNKWNTINPKSVNLKHPVKTSDVVVDSYFQSSDVEIEEIELGKVQVKSNFLAHPKSSPTNLTKLNDSQILDQLSEVNTHPNTSETNSEKGDDKGFNSSYKNYKQKHLLLDKKSLSFLSYNIWFNDYNWLMRTKEILNICEQKNPDFICFQEVTQPFMNQLMECPFIKSNFYITNIPFQLKNWYDVVILSKYCCNAYVTPLLSKMSRKLLYITLFNKDNELIKIGTTHLESMNNMFTRESQLQLCYNIIENAEGTSLPKYNFLIGDFNFAEKDNKFILSRGYTDYGLELIKKNQGNEENWHTMKSMKGYPAWRPDRFTYKVFSDTFNMLDFQIVGKDPILKETFFNPVGTPSDHYGVYAKCGL